LKPSGRPAVSRTFSVEDVRTEGQHRPDARSSFFNFYLELDFMFRHGSGNFSGFQEDFYTRISVFIITLCLSIGLRQNWCLWKAKKKSYNLNVWTSNRNIQTAHLPDRKRVASGRPPELRCF
jgi:hypothetical protein